MRTKLELDDEGAALLEDKLTSFLTRWAQHDLIPQFEKVLTQCRQELLPELRQKLQALRDRAGGTTVTAPRAKPDVDFRKGSSIGTEVNLRLTDWTDSRLRAIDTQDLATVAFDTSDRLKMEFRGDKSAFLAYWRSLRRKEIR